MRFSSERRCLLVQSGSVEFTGWYRVALVVEVVALWTLTHPRDCSSDKQTKPAGHYNHPFKHDYMPQATRSM